MAANYKMAVPFIDGHGNFGSWADEPAAQRYTEMRLTEFTQEVFFKDITKKTVDWISNFDGEEQEPVFLPASIPICLLSYSQGIGYGFASTWLPHNINDILDLSIAYVENKAMTQEQMQDILKGPDFPSGGVINGTAKIKQAYNCGKGLTILRGTYHIEEQKNKSFIVIDEVPYQLAPENVIEAIATLYKNDIISIKDVRNESDLKNKCRIVIELRKDEDVDRLINIFYKHRILEKAFTMNHNLLTTDGNGIPLRISLVDYMRRFIEFREEVLMKKFLEEKEQKEYRSHIIEGILIIHKDVHKAIDLIQASKDKSSSRKALMDHFKLSEIQAEHIVELKLYSLSRMNIDGLTSEKQALVKRIAELVKLTSAKSNKYMDKYMIDEWKALKEKYSDKKYQRKTKILQNYKKVDISTTIKDEECTLIVTSLGYVKRVAGSIANAQNRGGIGVGIDLVEDDSISQIINVRTITDMIALTSTGNVYAFQPYMIDESKKDSKGKLLKNIFNLRDKEKIVLFTPVEKSTDKSLITITTNGMIKSTSMDELMNINSKGKKLVGIDNKTGKLVSAIIVDKSDKMTNNVLITTLNGQAIRIDVSQIRNSGRGSVGVTGIKLNPKDEVSCMSLIRKGSNLVFISSNGFIKRVNESNFRCQTRGGYGVIAASKSDDYGSLIAVTLEDKAEINIYTKLGKLLRCDLTKIKDTSKSSKGVIGIKLNKDDEVIGID